MKRKVKKIFKKILVCPVYLVHFLIVEVWMGAGVDDVWDRMLKWADQ